jgi:hypothetical protein
MSKSSMTACHVSDCRWDSIRGSSRLLKFVTGIQALFGFRQGLATLQSQTLMSYRSPHVYLPDVLRRLWRGEPYLFRIMGHGRPHYAPHLNHPMASPASIAAQDQSSNGVIPPTLLQLRQLRACLTRHAILLQPAPPFRLHSQAQTSRPSSRPARTNITDTPATSSSLRRRETNRQSAARYRARMNGLEKRLEEQIIGQEAELERALQPWAREHLRELRLKDHQDCLASAVELHRALTEEGDDLIAALQAVSPEMGP